MADQPGGDLLGGAGRGCGGTAEPIPRATGEQQAIAVATIAVGPVTRNVPGSPVSCPMGGCHEYGTTDQVVPEDAEPMRTDHTTVYYNIPIYETFDVMRSARGRLAAAAGTSARHRPPATSQA